MTLVMKSMEEEKSPLSSIFSSGFYSQMQQEGSKVRRPRKKAKEIVDGGDAEIFCEGKKRRLSDEQVRFLEMNFGKERKLESCRKLNLASEIGLEPKQVAVWFQNRRARWKSKQLEEEYIHLRSTHDTVLIEKCRLENEILNLKDKLVQSEEEIRRLTSAAAAAAGEVAGGGSPISSLTMATHLGEFGMEEDGMQMPAYADSYYYMMEMSYLYGM